MLGEYRPYYWSIEDLFKNNVFSIPVYQRPFSWEKEQVSSLFSDIYKSFKDDGRLELFIGTIYIKNNDKVNNGKSTQYELIDGQQRISTLTCLLISLYVAIKNRLDLSIDHKDISLIRESLWKKVSREENDINIRLLESTFIENEIYHPLFNEAYNNPMNYKNVFDNLVLSSPIHKRVINCFALADKFIANKLTDDNKLLDFSDYIMNSVKMIVIETSTDLRRVFNMFESLNSKGKHLEEIDLIKTYIFSLLNESDYENYLKKWGELTLNTLDNLEDYLWTFIKSFIKYYKYGAKFNIFKPFSKNDLHTYYNKKSNSDALKHFIMDLHNNIKYYIAINDIKEFEKIVKKNKISFYFRIFKLLKYEHPRPLIMRLIHDYDNKLITSADLLNAFRSILSFMIIFQTLSNRDSKDSIPIFQEILIRNYRRDNVDVAELVKLIENKMSLEGIDKDKIKSLIEECTAYKDKKMSDIGFVLLTIYESIDVNNFRVSYDNANSILKSKDELSGDHILVQTPKENSNYKYRISEENGEEVLILLDKHDFPEFVYNKMIYDNFRQQVLNKIGNIRLAYRDNNSSRGNKELTLKNEILFNTYTQLAIRKKAIADLILKSNFFTYPKTKRIQDRSEQEIKVVWDNLDYYTGKSPVSFNLLDTKVIVNNNTELLKEVFKILYDLNKEPFERFSSVASIFENDKKPVFSKNSNNLGTAMKIENTDIYFETNNSTEKMLKILKYVVFDGYELDDSDFEVFYRNKI